MRVVFVLQELKTKDDDVFVFTALPTEGLPKSGDPPRDSQRRRRKIVNS